MDDAFLEPRENIDTAALLARLKSYSEAVPSAGAGQHGDGAPELKLSRALREQAELNRHIVTAIRNLGDFLDEIDARVIALERRDARVERTGDGVAERAASNDGVGSGPDAEGVIEALRASLRVSLAGLDAMLADRHGRPR
ncbi:MAG TPA: hypothetical protein VFC51_15040 [Chloroflexota bacterium]|nr:hypothetical protein [Chloroflexota bacterium]